MSIGRSGRVSHCFSLAAGARQGEILSPLPFAIFIDAIVDLVKTLIEHWFKQG